MDGNEGDGGARRRTRFVKKYFVTDYAKTGKSRCKYSGCKTRIEGRLVRLGRIMHNPFDPTGGSMVNWYHPECLFMGAMRTLTRCGAKHKKEPTCGDAMPRPESLGAVVLKFLRDTEDVKGFGRLAPKDQDSLRHLLETHIPPLIELYNNLNKERVPDTSSDTTSPTLCTTASATATTKTTEPAQSAFFDNPRGSELCDVTRWYYKDDSGDGSDSSGWMPFSVSTDIEEAFQAHQPMCKVSEEQFIDFEEMLLRFFGDFSASTAKPVRRG